MPFLHERLDNGLDVIAETSPAALSTSVGFFVTTGARDEDDALWGASHFLEHMVFKGTADLSADDINRRFDALGAAANAFTSEEDTVYYAAVLPRHQHEAVDLLARMMRPALRSEDFTTEKLVILEEIRMYDDQPPFGADDACRAAFFGAHPLARSVLGSVDSIGALAVEQLREYHARRYAPNELVLAAAGAVDFPALVDSARRLCGDWEPRRGPDRRVPGVPRAAARAGRERIVRAGAALEYAVRMTAGPAGGDVDRWAAALLALVLGDASGSRLYWACVDGGDAEQASCQHHEFLDAGLFVTHLACAGADTERLLERILEVYRAAATGVAAAELAQARNKLAGRIVLAGERPRSRLFDVGLEWTHHGGYRSVADTLRLVEGLTTADLDRVLAAWPLDAPSAEVLAGPGPG